MRRETKRKTNRPDPPEDLDGEALLEWDRVCDEIELTGRLTRSHRAIITLYVEIWARWKVAMRNITAHGSVVKFPNGYPGLSPFYIIARECEPKLAKLANELGITPARMPATNATTDDGDLDL